MRLPWTARTRRLVFVLVALVVLTFPLVSTLTTRSKVRSDGQDVTAAVVKAPAHDGQYFLEFRFPRAVDPDQRTYGARVDHASYEKAATSKTVTVRVLEGRPTAHEVAGEIHSRSPWIVTGVADALVLAVGLWWVRVGRRRPSLRMLAMRDVEAVTDPGQVATLERDSGDLYAAVGPVTAADHGTLTIALPDRSLVVRLNGYANHAEVGATARVWGSLVG